MRCTLVLLSSFVLFACGGSPEPSSSAGSPEPTAGGDTHAAAHPDWDAMSHEERAHYMAEVVVPEMRPLFQEHDAARFADFGCATCHGANGREVGFHMPNGLHPLDRATTMATFQSQDPSALWMTQRVWPRMAELIGEPPFDMATGEGFRCVDCHADGEAPTPAP